MIERKISRRVLLQQSIRGAAGLGAIAIAGCSDDEDAPVAPTSSATAPPPTQTAPAPTPPPASSVWTWSPVEATAGPSARRDHSLTFNPDDGHIYLFGGRARGVADNQLWSFDPRSGVWQQLAASGTGPGPRFGHNAVYDTARKRLIVALGQGNGIDFFNDVWAYDGAAWAALGEGDVDRPATRYGSASALDDAAQLIVSHGFTDSGRFDDTWTNDVATGTWRRHATAGPLPVKRCLARGVWLPERRSFLMFGGQTDTNPFLGDQWTLDVRMSVWTEEQAAILPGPRNLYGAATSRDGSQWLIAGGNTPEGPTDEVWIYDLASAVWTQITPEGAAPPARYSGDAAFADDGLYMFGGHDGKSEIDDLWVLQRRVIAPGST
jgi:hypothetical protein